VKRHKANMWRTSQPVVRPPLAGVRIRTTWSHSIPGTATGENPRVAERIAEQRFGNRADKLLRRFSWEDGE